MTSLVLASTSIQHMHLKSLVNMRSLVALDLTGCNLGKKHTVKLQKSLANLCIKFSDP